MVVATRHRTPNETPVDTKPQVRELDGIRGFSVRTALSGLSGRSANVHLGNGCAEPQRDTAAVGNDPRTWTRRRLSGRSANVHLGNGCAEPQRDTAAVGNDPRTWTRRRLSGRSANVHLGNGCAEPQRDTAAVGNDPRTWTRRCLSGRSANVHLGNGCAEPQRDTAAVGNDPDARARVRPGRATVRARRCRWWWRCARGLAMTARTFDQWCDAAVEMFAHKYHYKPRDLKRATAQMRSLFDHLRSCGITQLSEVTEGDVAAWIWRDVRRRDGSVGDPALATARFRYTLAKATFNIVAKLGAAVDPRTVTGPPIGGDRREVPPRPLTDEELQRICDATRSRRRNIEESGPGGVVASERVSGRVAQRTRP